ncbi:peptidoglycan-binding domain-containing protein [Roseibium sp.]|uniref:peptidoglycan-binding domain-containing protein n=1 Tax=Roseibium sp. TaxID=1936156 RepID=UPI003B519F1B
MAKQGKRSKKQEPPETMMSRAGHVARDNPVAAGGTVVMGLTACLIIANAVGLQPGRHPAPYYSTRAWPDTVQVPEPDGRRGLVPVQEISTLVLDLQISLRKLGLYVGPLDGVNGPATERAIRAFERRAGRVETGQANEGLLALVLLHGDDPVALDAPPVPRTKPRASGTTSVAVDQEVAGSVDADPKLKKIQYALSQLGYGPLIADGVMGGNTSAALRRFELDRGLPETGEPNPETLERLEMVSGQRFDR